MGKYDKGVIWGLYPCIPYQEPVSDCFGSGSSGKDFENHFGA